jgi:hypothetical protein
MMITAIDLYFALSDRSSELYRKMESLRPQIGKKPTRAFSKASADWNRARLAAGAASEMLDELREKRAAVPVN